MSNIIASPHDESRPELDDLLREYFHAEMPHPWPGFKAPSAGRAKRSGSVWSRYAGRVALAACVALLVAGYLAVAGYFPGTNESNRLEQVIPNIATKDQGLRTEKANERVKSIKTNQTNGDR